MTTESEIYDEHAKRISRDHQVEMVISVRYPVPADAVPDGHSAAAAEQLSYEAGDFTALEALETAARQGHRVSAEFRNIY